MNIRKRAEEIQRLVDIFQDEVNMLDEKFKLRHFNIFCYDFSQDPMQIHLLKHTENDALVSTLKISFTDLFYCNQFVEDLEDYLETLKKQKAPADMIQELILIREIFGV